MIRTRFVSNSSSSSFTVPLGCLTNYQISAIHDHISEAERLGIEYYDDPWHISSNDNCIVGSTSMDNFDMHDFFRRIGVPPQAVTWSE
jgi:hypothetical protein